MAEPTPDAAERAETETSLGTDVSEAVVTLPLDDLEDLGMEHLVATARAAGLRDFTELVCSSGGCVLHVVTDDPVPTAELEALPYVEWWESLREGPDAAASIGKLCQPQPAEELDPPADTGVAATDHEVRGDQLAISLVGDRGDVADRVRSYQAAGAHPTLERLADYRGGPDPLGALTERQEAVLREAHAQGYFEVPRQATTAEVAAALDLDDSTVAEHLQRAQRTIVDGLLGE